MSDYELNFWQQVYVAAIRRGEHSQRSADIADEAVSYLKQRYK